MHAGAVEGRKGVNIGPPQANFKRLVNKNEIKPKIGDPLAKLSGKPWPPGIPAKIWGTPSPGFSTRVHQGMVWSFVSCTVSPRENPVKPVWILDWPPRNVPEGINLLSSTEELDEQVLEGESLWKKVVHVQTVADLVLDVTRFNQFWMSENL